ncbi:MAG: methyl-accepting chemotaxis protein, partial [Candidatus Methylumidiphilus sp.]
MKQLLSDLLGRLRLWQKLTILGVIALVLVAIPFYLFFVGEQAVIDTALEEQKGMEPAVKMVDVVRATAKHRGLSASLLAGREALDKDRRAQKTRVDQAIAAYDTASKGLDYPGTAEVWRQFKEEWVKVEQGVESRTISREQSWDAHTRLNSHALRLIRLIADGSHLSLDPDPDTYHLIQAILIESSILSEKLGQARGFGASLLAKAETLRAQSKPPAVGDKGVTVQERAAVFSMADRARESLNSINQELEQFQISAPAAVKTRLEASARQMNALVDKSLPLARSEIVDAANLTYSSTEYFGLLTQAIDAAFAFTDDGSALLKELFERKISAARTAQYTTSGVILLIFAFAALLAVLISRSITGPVGHLVAVMDRLAMGDNKIRANLETYDEIGALGRQFDIMVDQREAVSEKVRRENEQLNNSVIELMQAVARLANKDLTVKVPVAEDITGLVADALNMLSTETANVMNRVVDIAGKVAAISRQVKTQSDAVIGVATEEKLEVEQAAAELSLASEVMQGIATLALSCNQAAEQAIHNTDRAQETVLGTVEGITTIRDTIRETEKRIKRLGERSQEIGGVVNLINGIAERTHILAINASMHAA